MNQPPPIATPWYRNPLAIAGYALQTLGALIMIATLVQASPIPGMPAWMGPVCGLVLAAASKLSLDGHSAWVRGKELEAQTQLAFSAPAVTVAPAPPPGPPAPYTALVTPVTAMPGAPPNSPTLS